MIDDDPRLQQGAYITDGIELYEVRARERGRAMMSIAMAWVVIENCRTLSDSRLLGHTIKRGFNLVRTAPVASCPDLPEDIAWEQTPARPHRRPRLASGNSPESAASV